MVFFANIDNQPELFFRVYHRCSSMENLLKCFFSTLKVVQGHVYTCYTTTGAQVNKY